MSLTESEFVELMTQWSADLSGPILEIYNYAKEIQSRHPDKLKIESGGRSRTISLVRNGISGKFLEINPYSPFVAKYNADLERVGLHEFMRTMNNIHSRDPINAASAKRVAEVALSELSKHISDVERNQTQFGTPPCSRAIINERQTVHTNALPIDSAAKSLPGEHDLLAEFDHLYRTWCNEAHLAAGYSSRFLEYGGRVSETCRAWVVRAVQLGLCIPIPGRAQFRISEEGGRRFSWFSNNRSDGTIGPNWEYFPHVGALAEFVLRYHYPARCLAFDRGIAADIIAWKDGKAGLMVEVKEKRDVARNLTTNLANSFVHGVPMDIPDRKNDPLRKAKYITNERPTYFATYAMAGIDQVFRVEYTTGGFLLKEMNSLPAYMDL